MNRCWDPLTIFTTKGMVERGTWPDLFVYTVVIYFIITIFKNVRDNLLKNVFILF